MKLLYYDTLPSCAQRKKGIVTESVDLVPRPLQAKHSNTSKKVKQSRYRHGVAQRVPGS